MIQDNKIEEYLANQHLSFDKGIQSLINSKLNEAQAARDNEKANYYWYLQEILYVQKGYVESFELIKTGKYEEAWLLLDKSDIALGYIEENFPSTIQFNKFNLGFISKMIKEYQKLFPYHLFLSREAIIREEKCSICGQIIKLRHGCSHIPGKVYMGKLCLREVTKIELKAVALVTDPFDKYTIIHPEGKEYNYGMLEYLMEEVHSPYISFRVEIRKEKNEEFKGIGRNELCPCGSGKKYKKCHLGTKEELHDHYVVCYESKTNHTHKEPKYFSTWVE